MPTQPKRWLVLACSAMAAMTLTLPAAESAATAGKPPAAAAPAATGSAAASSAAAALPSSSPAPKLPGNDPALFASSVPVNSSMVAAPSDGPSTSFAVNLLKRLVKRGILAQEDADELTREAQADAQAARVASQAEAAAASQAVVAQVEQKAAEMRPPAPGDDEVRVTYIPEVVKQQMREDIRRDVMAQVRAENWAAPRAIPEWVPLFRFSGDIRTRYEGDFFPNSNDNTGAFPNFNAINTGAPFDTQGSTFSPQYNVDQNRNRFRIRARIGADIDLNDGWTAGIRLASGQDNSPVTENQTIGLANQGQGGDFSKYAIWLDRAYLRYQYMVDGDPNRSFSATVGRQDNPFYSTSMIWARDLGFDGLTLQGRYPASRRVTPFLTLGAYPVFNTDFNFASNQPAKYQSADKYLFAGQLGADWNINKDWNTKVAVAYYHFNNIQGKLSSPFTPLSASDQGNTDNSRPSFAQNGNTYFPIRNIVPTAQNNFGAIDQFQYYGLASPFQELDFTGQLNFDKWAPVRVSLVGEFTKNLAFNGGNINQVAVNNRGTSSKSSVDPVTGQTVTAPGQFEGGDTAWIMTLRVGKVALEKFGDWAVDVGYRYVESDAIVDGFADSDFGYPLAGTNLKGWTVGGDLALGSRVWLSLHFMSADSIAGPPYKNDIIQFDLNGRF